MGQHNRALHQGADLTYNEALRVRKLFEEFPEIFIPLFVCRTQHLQITECLLKRGAGMSTEKWEWENRNTLVRRRGIRCAYKA